MARCAKRERRHGRQIERVHSDLAIDTDLIATCHGQTSADTSPTDRTVNVFKLERWS